jgi:hypothetical protein
MKTNKPNSYGDGSVYRGIVCKDSEIETLTIYPCPNDQCVGGKINLFTGQPRLNGDAWDVGHIVIDCPDCSKRRTK